jgi:hypothetical protein
VAGKFVKGMQLHFTSPERLILVAVLAQRLQLTHLFAAQALHLQQLPAA